MSFKPVRDPVTGRLDMVPVTLAEWGDKADSPSTALAMGRKRYKAALAMIENGGLSSAADLHDVTLAEISGLLAPHLFDSEVGELSRRWIEIASLVRDGTLRLGTLGFQVNMGGEDRFFAINMSREDIVLTSFVVDGGAAHEPIVYWIEGGCFSAAPVEPDQVDDLMVDIRAQLRRSDLTHIVMLARQAADACPAGVIDMKAWQTLRYARAA